ncbi:MAG: flagellar filament capping protein FliD [Devosia sp.]|nr:flagellar filament capping protein FliD [Devosia sp.]
MSTVSSTSSSTSSSSTSSSSTTSNTTNLDNIDWNGLIEEAVQAKLDKADAIDLKITNNEAKSAAYTKMQTLLAAVETAAQALRAPSGTSMQSTDVFQSRAAYLTANGDVDASTTLAATVESGSTKGSYDLEVSQLAKSEKVGGTAVSSDSTDLGYSGVIAVGTDSSSLTDITITSGMTLAEVAEAINNESDTTGVQASVLKVSSTQYQLVLATTDTGETITANAVSGDDVLNTLGITASDGSFANVLQESAQAIFSVDGVQITRSSNDVDDVISGVTLHLYQTTPTDTSVTVEIGTDVSKVKDAISTLVDAYNAYRDFAYAQQSTTSTTTDDSGNTTTTDSVLFGDGTLRSTNDSLSQALNTMIDSNSLQLLGLSLGDTNDLELDSDTLDNALLSNLDAVQSLLSFQMTSSSSDVRLLSRGTASVPDLTLDVAVDSSGALTSASVGGDSSLFTVSGTRIVGATGSIYEGYTFVYTGTTSQSIDLSFSSGIAEQLYNVTDAVSNTTDGSLETLIDNISTTDDTLQNQSDDIRSAAATYKTNLTARYATVQAAIASAESSNTYLTTLIDTWNSSSS